ncbi:putative lipoprotein [Vulgatibacter incomptus]|uniref:Putative lipoprotein n=1 Tax=Vulgatibacter incomptus TaxID=1391653 RepID=A0A0K1PHD0_9BACT|nr:putative lipoprotein [Vulgatibacter incomptus]
MGVLALAYLSVGCGRDRVVQSDGIALAAPAALDFGRVGLGATVVRKLEIHNGGRAPLSLDGFSIPGSGVDFELLPDSRTRLREGQTSTLSVRFTPKEEAVLSRMLEVQTNDPRRPTLQIPVTGVGVRPRVVATPASLDFGKVELGSPFTMPLLLENDFDIPVEVVLGQRGDPQFSMSPSGSVPIAANGKINVNVVFLPTRLGVAGGQVTMVPCPICDEVEVPMAGIGIDQALVVTPTTIDFDYIPVERQSHRSFTMSNVSSHPVQITSMNTRMHRPVFTFTPFTGTLQPGETRTFDVRFAPVQNDPEEDFIDIASDSRRSPVIPVHLLGRGGGPKIQVTPRALAFGSVPIGARGQLPLIVTNAGTDPGPALRITAFRVENPATTIFGADRDLVAQPVAIPGGTSETILIGYEPTQVSDDAGDHAELVIVSNDDSFPEVRIPMSGSAFGAPTCRSLVLTPPFLDFGSFDEGWGGVLSFQIFNPGPELCIMRDLRIAAGSDPVFTTRPVSSFVIPGYQWFGWMVAFDPHAVGAGTGYFRGELELFAANAAQRRYAIPLVAGSLNGCLRATPNFLDFGTAANNCGTSDRTVRITNTCPVEVNVGPILLGAQSSEGEFTIAQQPTTPFLLGSGASFDVAVHWNTLVRGINSAPLYLYEDGRTDLPLTIPVLGELLDDGRVIDRFVQHRPLTTDMLLVVDNSGSMVDKQPRLRSAAHVLLDEAARLGVDLHVGVTTTGVSVSPGDVAVCPGGANGNEAGRLFPVDESRPRIVTRNTPNARQVLEDNTQVGLCHELVQDLEAMRLALSEPLTSGANRGFLRPEANLSVVLVGDEDDHSGYPPATYSDFLRGLKGIGGSMLNAIVDTGPNCSDGVAFRMIEAAHLTGGTVSSICDRDFTPAFRRIADAAFAPLPSFFRLSEPPDNLGIHVFVGGNELPASAFRFDRANNQVSFAPGAAPPPGTSFEVHYTKRCGS